MSKAKKLTHVDESGDANMVDVGAKPISERIAEAKAEVQMNPETLALILTNSFETVSYTHLPLPTIYSV